MPKLDWACSTH